MRLKIILAAFLSALALNAVSMDYLSNNSASYFQNPSQTGKITVEGVFYNPAGTAFLEDGKYAKFYDSRINDIGREKDGFK